MMRIIPSHEQPTQSSVKGARIHELVEGKGTWSYPTTFNPGALRLVEVKPLLQKKSSRLVLHEFCDVTLGALDIKDHSKFPKYAAISHVWQPSPAIASRQNIRPLQISLEDDKTHEISWLGLMQAAIAATHFNCEFIWLDFICLNQLSKEDKKLQIKNMANIYAYCACTIVMLGGIRSAQRLEDESFWHTRAWTLQEGIESMRRGRNALRYALIEWPYDPKHYEVFRRQFYTLKEGLAVVHIRELLDLQGNGMPISKVKRGGKYRPPEYIDSPILIPVRCFGENVEVIMALLRPLTHSNWEMDSSIWRNLWVRTSSKEHDILYSSMNLFAKPVSLQVDYKRNFEDLLIEFIATLHEDFSVPNWFKIGHYIPTYPWSGLFPVRPNFERHLLPTYSLDDSCPRDADELLCDSGCCSDLDLCVELKGASRHAGHTLCAKFLKLERVAITPTLPNYTNRCWQHVRKILVSYPPDGSNFNALEWGFELDADARTELVETFPKFDGKSTKRNKFDSNSGKMVIPKYNKTESWIRSRTEGADLSPLSRTTGASSVTRASNYITGLCWFDGSLGPYAAIIGFYNSHYQNPVVYFFDKDSNSTVRHVGTGKFLVDELDRIKSDIPWRHLIVGGEVAPAVPFEECTCKAKEEVPVIGQTSEDVWSDTW